MFNQVTSRWPHQGTIKVEWNLGKRCNYDCTYCPSEIHDNTSPHTPLATMQEAIDRLSAINKPIRLSFTGGEPCVHPEFEEIVKYAKYKGISWISVTTNGTRPFEFYKMLAEYVDQYVVSIHFEYNWLRVLNTITHLADESKVALIGQIMAHHEHMSNVRTARGRLQQEGVPCTVRRIRWTQGDHDLFDDMRYHPDDLAWIKSQESTVGENTVLIDDTLLPVFMHANDVIKLHYNKFKDWTCNAGLESLMINCDGEVYRATCRVGGALGNIYNGTFVSPATPVTCDRNFCTCAADIPLTKFKL